MEEAPKNQEGGVGDGSAEVLSEMPSFEEHMDKKEQDAPIGEKYYEQAKEERERWVEISRNHLDYCRGLEPEKFKKLTNPEIFDHTGKLLGRPEYAPLDEDNANDIAEFNVYKDGEIRRAEEKLLKDENADLDELARSFKNKELIDGIAAKMKNDEELTDEEKNFFG